MEQGITTFISGGLGNQMFQYAAARALALRYDCPLQLDTSWYAKNFADAAPRSFHLHIFSPIKKHAAIAAPHSASRVRKVLQRMLGNYAVYLRIPVAPPAEIAEPHFAYWKGFECIQPPAFLRGYWQSDKYFRKYADTIRHDFTFPPLPNPEALSLAEAITSCHGSTAVHIRRGDYASDKKIQALYGVLDMEYYSRALEIIQKTFGELRLFVFSDDPEWAHSHVGNLGFAYEVVALNLPDRPHVDMQLMALCRHHVIANSSFSWWGAWLSTEDGMTIAPRRWFTAPSIDTRDVCPAQWIRI